LAKDSGHRDRVKGAGLRDKGEENKVEDIEYVEQFRGYPLFAILAMAGRHGSKILSKSE
jgi:hypothetical protein